MKTSKILIPLIFLLSASLPGRADAGTVLTDLRVEHASEPLAVEAAHPAFSWKMISSRKGQKQTAWQIRVRRESDGYLVWDSGEVEDSLSTGIRYLGAALRSGTGYAWDLTVTDGDGKKCSASSRFETGLMDPRLSAWKGATWIGDSRPGLDAASLACFRISSDFIIVKGKTAGFILGADDFRLKDVFQNPWGLAGDNYFKVVLDFSGYGTPDGSQLRIYRVGYASDDSPSEPLLTVSRARFPDCNLDRILKGGPADDHHFAVDVRDGGFAFEIDGQPLSTEAGGAQARFPVSPAGGGSFPHLCSVGFAADPGADVTYTGYKIEDGRRTLFEGASQYRRFEVLSCVRLPRYRNQNAYENDIVVINKGEREVVETIDPSYGGTKLLRSEFSTAQGRKVRKAKLYVTALGVYDFYVNGQKVGDGWFAPGPGRYSERVTYQAYDVTALVRSGRNALGAGLYEGGYAGGTPALLGRLDLCYEDGTTEYVVSRPADWKTSDVSPVRAAGFRQGERYDAVREAALKGWSEPGYDDSRWRTAEAVSPRGWEQPYLTARCDEPVRVRETLTAVERAVAHSEDYHTHIYDMGTRMVGVPELHVPAGWLRKGDVVIIRYATQLDPGPEGAPTAGHLCFETGGALDTDFYIAAGPEETVIRPRSAWHGYRYVQVTLPSHEGPLPLDRVKGLVLSSCPLPTGTYTAVTADGETGEWATQLAAEARSSLLGDLFTLSMETPGQDPDGRMQALCRTAACHADVLGFFRQWMADLRDGRTVDAVGDEPGSAAVCRVPWEMYRQYGDSRIVEENLDPMMDWLNASGINASNRPLAEAVASMAAAVGRSDYARVLRGAVDAMGEVPAPEPSATPDALPALSRAGRWEEAYALFAALDAPSPAELGAVGQWMYEYQLGISPGAEAGYRHFVLQPVAGGDFRSLTGSIESEYGRICSAWMADGAGRMTAYTAEVPSNASATLYLPFGEGEPDFGENAWARYCGTEVHNGIRTAVYELSPGRHAFLISDTQITVE